MLNFCHSFLILMHQNRNMFPFSFHSNFKQYLSNVRRKFSTESGQNGKLKSWESKFLSRECEQNKCPKWLDKNIFLQITARKKKGKKCSWLLLEWSIFCSVFYEFYRHNMWATKSSNFVYWKRVMRFSEEYRRRAEINFGNTDMIMNDDVTECTERT